MVNSDKIKMVLEEVQKRFELPSYLENIRLNIPNENGGININQILSAYNVNESVAKAELLHLIIEYIKIVLEDNILTTDEKENINYLKKLLWIRPGDFINHNKPQVENIIAYQLSKIYQDNLVNEEEALFKVNLQEIFDLSFDEMNDYSKINAAISIRQGADPKDLDIFFSNSEYFKLR